MIKQSWDIPKDEFARILEMHEKATKNKYLFREQAYTIKKIEPQKFQLPANTFASGKYKEINKQAVDQVLNQLSNALKEYPENQKIEVEIESSESKVPPPSGMEVGDLSRLRGEEIGNYIKNRLPNNVVIKYKSLGAQGPEWDPKKGKDNSAYTQNQYVSLNLVGSGEKQEINCNVGLQIIVEYRKEWCNPGNNGDLSKCHKCNEAVFNMSANGIPLLTTDKSEKINLNNDDGSSKWDYSGGSRKVILQITPEQKNEILKVNPNAILITLECALPECHKDQIHIEINNDAGQQLLPGTFIGTTTAGQKLKKGVLVKLLKLDPCGRKLAVFGDQQMVSDVESEKLALKKQQEIKNEKLNKFISSVTQEGVTLKSNASSGTWNIFTLPDLIFRDGVTQGDYYFLTVVPQKDNIEIKNLINPHLENALSKYITQKNVPFKINIPIKKIKVSYNNEEQFLKGNFNRKLSKVPGIDGIYAPQGVYLSDEGVFDPRTAGYILLPEYGVRYKNLFK